MLALLDLAWVHWGSFWFGVIAAAACSLVTSIGLIVLPDWCTRRRERALDRDVEEVRLRAAAPPLPRPRRRHPPELGLYLPAGSRIPSIRHSPILDREASEQLWYEVNGDRDTV